MAPVPPFCKHPMHPSESGEADSGLKRKNSSRPWTSPARPPGSCILAQAAQAKGQAELGLLPEPLRQRAQQATLLAREVSAFRSPGDEYAGMTPSPLARSPVQGAFYRSFQSSCEALNEERGRKPARVWAAFSMPCPHLHPHGQYHHPYSTQEETMRLQADHVNNEGRTRTQVCHPPKPGPFHCTMRHSTPYDLVLIKPYVN